MKVIFLVTMLIFLTNTIEVHSSVLNETLQIIECDNSCYVIEKE